MSYKLVYKADLGKMADQMNSAESVGDGSKLVFALTAMRLGHITWKANKSGEGAGWKGITTTANLPEMQERSVRTTDLSKAVRVIQEFLPEAVDCDDADVVSHVLAFQANHGSVDKEYTALKKAEKGDDSSGGWTLDSAMDTLVRKARKENIDSHTVTLSLERALKAFYG